MNERPGIDAETAQRWTCHTHRDSPQSLFEILSVEMKKEKKKKNRNKNRSDTINKKEKKNPAKSDISESPSGGIFCSFAKWMMMAQQMAKEKKKKEKKKKKR